MVGYFPAELFARWNSSNSNNDKSTQDVPLNAKFISSSSVLKLGSDSSERIEEEVNDFVYTGIFLGKSSGEIVCSPNPDKPEPKRFAIN